MDQLRIIESKEQFVSAGEFDLDHLAKNCETSKTGFHITVGVDEDRHFDFWISLVNSHPNLSFQGAVEACQECFTSRSKNPNTSRIFTFSIASDLRHSSAGTSTFLIVISPTLYHEESSLDEEDPLLRISDEKREEDSLFIVDGDIKALLFTVRKSKALAAAGLATLFILAALGLFFLVSQDRRYERYPTPGSVGPKHQTRLLSTNATTWAREVKFDESKWRVRIDDQALVPSHLYDNGEERYQKWFRQRYPHLQDIVERKDYLRPSWLGSSQIAVPWDEQFHFAHCVLALRRYWVAKETGTHVCGRDIDHAHMKHCLDSLDEKAFPPGPMDTECIGCELWWQTKVCYD